MTRNSVKSRRSSRSSRSKTSSAVPDEVVPLVIIARQMPDSIGPEAGSAPGATVVTAVALGWCRDAQPSTNAPQTTRTKPVPML